MLITLPVYGSHKPPLVMQTVIIKSLYNIKKIMIINPPVFVLKERLEILWGFCGCYQFILYL